MRAKQERLAAEHAEDPKIAALHVALAERYEELANEREGPSALRIGS
jgi:hypothetical protein